MKLYLYLMNLFNKKSTRKSRAKYNLRLAEINLKLAEIEMILLTSLSNRDRHRYHKEVRLLNMDKSSMIRYKDTHLKSLYP